MTIDARLLAKQKFIEHIALLYRDTYDPCEPMETALVDLITDLYLYADTISDDEMEWEDRASMYFRMQNRVTTHYTEETTLNEV